ncbi:Uncharacterised protein [Cronobacter sakazakii]|nr:Uncharacterised protein [Cronobacter sakazakii]
MTDQTQNPWDTGSADAAANSASSADAWGSPTPAAGERLYRLAEQRARACARAFQHYGSVP